jgi:hypothetical protein
MKKRESKEDSKSEVSNNFSTRDNSLNKGSISVID